MFVGCARDSSTYWSGAGAVRRLGDKAWPAATAVRHLFITDPSIFTFSVLYLSTVP